MKAKNCIEETGKVRRPATRKVRDDPGDVPGVNQILRQSTTWSTLDLEPSHGINHQKASEVADLTDPLQLSLADSSAPVGLLTRLTH